MYAVRKFYVRNYDSMPMQDRYSVKVAQGGKPLSGLKPERVFNVDEEVMTWRKANHIHAWFVQNVQDDQDDCKTYYVDDDKLLELLSVCKKVIEASELVDGSITTGTVYNIEHQTTEVQRAPGKVIKDATVAKELLPTRRGFFFGNQEYDEGYLADVVATRDWIERMLKDLRDGCRAGIYYSSSW